MPVVPPCSVEKVDVPTEISFAPSVFTDNSPETVDDAVDTNPVIAPALFTEKSFVPAEFTNLRKSPVPFAVDEAWMKMVSVDVPASARSAFGISV